MRLTSGVDGADSELSTEEYEFVHLPPLPQCLNAFLNAIKDEAAYVTMVVRQLSVFCVGATGGWRWMKVIPRVVSVRMPIPSALPRAIPSFLLVMEVEVFVEVSANFEANRRFTRIVVTR